MKDYSAMTDFEINKAVASFNSSIYISEDGDLVYLELSPSAAFMGSDYDEVVFDPCNNPPDAWPIIVANRIALMPDSSAGEWLAFSDFTLYDGDWLFSSDPNQHVNDKNPLRAAMIVFLMMKDSEKTQ